MRSAPRLALFSFFMLCLASASAAEMVTIKLPEGQMRCEVLKMTKAEISLRESSGKNINVPFAVLTPKEVLACFRLLDDKFKDANLRFEMGSYFLKKQLNDAAKAELIEAVKLDSKLAEKATSLLKQLEGDKTVAAAPKVEEKEKEKEAPPAAKPPEPNENGNIPLEVRPGEKVEDAIKRTMEDFAKNFKKQNVPARTEKEMKEFIDKRLVELNDKIGGGKWRLIETKHFYSFSNLPELKHKVVSAEWLENTANADGTQGIYPLLCTVLRHKESDKLWNNKCPIYFFDKFSEFQNFAAAIDGSPGAGNSGGYFSARGREVHICIPFMKERLGEKGADRAARSTLYHEGTHAFLQLTGEDVPLARWLHEGLAQFIEFWYDSKNNPDRAQRAAYLIQEIRAGSIPAWYEYKERPQGGGDHPGYSWAWIKLEFLYRNFDNQRLPDMIRAIKAGKKEEEAMTDSFKFPPDKLEAGYQLWVKEQAKKGLNFHK